VVPGQAIHFERICSLTFLLAASTHLVLLLSAPPCTATIVGAGRHPRAATTVFSSARPGGKCLPNPNSISYGRQDRNETGVRADLLALLTAGGVHSLVPPKPAFFLPCFECQRLDLSHSCRCLIFAPKVGRSSWKPRAIDFRSRYFYETKPYEMFADLPARGVHSLGPLLPQFWERVEGGVQRVVGRDRSSSLMAKPVDEGLL